MLCENCTGEGECGVCHCEDPECKVCKVMDILHDMEKHELEQVRDITLTLLDKQT